MDNEYRITKRRKDDLERELVYLRTTRSREVAMMLEEARSYGDLTQNSEYDVAKNEQCKIYGRIAKIENILSRAVVIEDKRLSDDFIDELKKLIESCGLSTKQVESYVDYCCRQYEQAEQMEYGILPDDKCLETLKAAQRIVSGKPEYYALQDGSIARLLRVPCDRWQSAKAAIMECFGCSEETVDVLFNEDAKWLFVSPDSVYELADCLKALFSDKDIAWRIFRRAALLGVNTSKSRIYAVLDMLGEEFGKKVIRADAEENVWLFYMYYSDPVGCIAYMKESGLAPEKILTVVEQDPDILYLYKEGRKRSYNHDQDYIDSIIQRYK